MATIEHPATTGEKKLHLGCFDCPVDGWVNTDITPHLFIARVPMLATLMHRVGRLNAERYEQHQKGVFRKVRYMNVTKRFPFADNTFQCVFSAHMIEHIPKPAVPGLLSEIRRVLRPGGVVRTGAPDLDYFIAHYDATDPDTFVNGVFEIARNGVKNRHHWMYNRHSLPQLFADHGFVDVQVCDYQQGKCADLDRLDNRPEHTLFVEAFKP